MAEIKDLLNNVVLRPDGRAADELRPVRITRNFTDAPEGSVLIECGSTRVMCTATFTTGVPRWRKDSGLGWVTAEYAMLPRATAERTDRESVRGKIGGRTHEISRLIGRCLRGVVDMKALGENQIQLDCDVLQADGGTRTASITGAYVALVDALRWAERNRKIKRADKVLKDCVSAVSVGVINGTPMLDLPYIEDSQAMTDMNVAMTGSGQFIEIQGTAEHRPFSRDELNQLLDLAEKGNKELQAAQRAALAALHDPALALNGCDRLLVLADGGVRAVLDPARDALPVLQAQLAALYGRISLHRLRGADGREQLVMLKEEDPA